MKIKAVGAYSAKQRGQLGGDCDVTPPTKPVGFATSPSRGGLGRAVQPAHKGELTKLHATPEAPLLGGLAMRSID